jgi:hypothetical protein
VPYILGRSDAELRRLMLQAAILSPSRNRLRRETIDVVDSKGPFIAGTGQLLRCSDVIMLGIQEEPMPLTEKAVTALMTVAIAGVGPA